MKNIFDYKYAKHVAIGTAGVVLAASVGIHGIAKTEDRTSDKNNGELSHNVVIPSAGIAVLFEGADNETDTYEYELSSGIASVLHRYYDGSDKTVSVETIETVMKFLPVETENDGKKETGDTNTETNVDGDGNEKENEEQNADVQGAKTEEISDEEVTSVVDGYTVLGVADVTNYLNVRETPDLDGTLLGKLPMNAGCEILETLDGWYKVSSGNVEGYVSAEFLLTGREANERALQEMRKVAHVNADMLMVREEPNTDCTILTRVAEGEELEVVEELQGWIKVNIDDVLGYVSADYVDIYRTLPKGVTLKELSYGGGVSNTAVDLIEYAKQFLGNPYVWGGTSLTNGTDCSGFTMRVFEHFGYSLSRTSREQAYNGTRVAISDIQPGDLLFYNHGSSIGHVAIYIGDGQIIHASTERTGIIIGNAFYTTPACATRIIN